MNIDDLIKVDSSFSESGFIAKVDNTFTMLYSAFMMGDLTRVKHKISDEVEQEYQKMIDDLKQNNYRRVFDEFNVKSTEITSIEEDEDNYIIHVLIVSRYMDYIVNKTDFSYVSGINDHRIEKNNYLTFKKKKDSKKESDARKCPACGANIDANNTGKCSYCGSIYDTENYDWVLTSIRVE